MKNIFLAFLIFFVSGCSMVFAGINVTVDHRIELFSIIARLAQFPEYSHCRVPSYDRALNEHFSSFAEHPVIQAARSLRQKRGISYDAPISLAVHVEDAFTLKEIIPINISPPGLDRRWTTDETRDFLDKARDFVKVSSFRKFVDEQSSFYAETTAAARSILDKADIAPWFDRFFASGNRAGFTVCLGLVNGPNCYGARLQTASRLEFYSVIGVSRTDEAGRPTFPPDDLLPLVVHEFCHSYVNPMVDANLALFRKPASVIFELLSLPMKKQAYTNWKIMMYESIVRACVVRWVLAHQGMEQARKEVKTNHDRMFLWTGKLATLLGQYEKQRSDFPTFSDFIGQTAAFFDKCAPWTAKRLDELRGSRLSAAGAPTVVKISPVNGSTRVSPSLDSIKITFSQPMRDKSWSICGDGDLFPKLENPPSYDESRTTLTVPVRLEADHIYRLQLNTEKHKGFQSSAGVALAPKVISFSTTGE